ncbi:kinase-like domain-containing protein [Stachybotrys elegans]|uniref:Kinase-like domain-containing protein n=1 Tax=Stachybotrys elegans TaxID=80388 RepID=A0A8K0WS26_9HYPO|nr:kinase-like domain-containing protein [Stachybotrys elegans]
MAVFEEEKLFTYSDAELLRFIKSSPHQAPLRHIFLLSPLYIAKLYYNDAAQDAARATKLASELGVHVPCVRRIVRDGNLTYSVMDRIYGGPLHHLWSDLDWTRSMRLALQLRGMIRKMQSVQSKTAGSLETGQCRSFYLQDFYGLPQLAGRKEINAFLTFWMEFQSMEREEEKDIKEHVRRPKIGYSASRMNFVHHNLSPRNIMLDADGKLWLMNWDYAGFYPKSFEHAAMHSFMRTDWNRGTRMRWKVFSWIATGVHGRDAQLLEKCRAKFLRDQFGREANIKDLGYAAASGSRDWETSEGQSVL